MCDSNIFATQGKINHNETLAEVSSEVRSLVTGNSILQVKCPEKSFFLFQKEVRICSSNLRLIEILLMVHPLCWGVLSETQCGQRQEEGFFFFPSIREQVW